jgi:proteasome lid subunit RPN8/RPN11
VTELLSIDGVLFDELIEQLAVRGRGARESGAFLLTDRNSPKDRLPQPVTAIAYYDDLDPDCLNGVINFTADGYTALGAVCRRRELRVVGDVHTHPGRRVAQSPIDAAHPMVALDGHVAIIVPQYATGTVSQADLGVHLRRNGMWTSTYGSEAAAAIRVRLAQPALWTRIMRRIETYLNRARRKS